MATSVSTHSLVVLLHLFCCCQCELEEIFVLFKKLKLARTKMDTK